MKLGFEALFSIYIIYLYFNLKSFLNVFWHIVLQTQNNNASKVIKSLALDEMLMDKTKKYIPIPAEMSISIPKIPLQKFFSLFFSVTLNKIIQLLKNPTNRLM